MRVLVVEDSEKLRRSIVTALRQSGYAVDETGDGSQGFYLASSVEYDVMVLDLMLPGMDGLTMLDRLRAGNRNSHPGSSPPKTRSTIACMDSSTVRTTT